MKRRIMSVMLVLSMTVFASNSYYAGVHVDAKKGTKVSKGTLTNKLVNIPVR